MNITLLREKLMGKHRLLRDMEPNYEPSDAIKRKIDKMLESGELKPTVFVRENPDGTPCMEIETRVMAVWTGKDKDNPG